MSEYNVTIPLEEYKKLIKDNTCFELQIDRLESENDDLTEELKTAKKILSKCKIQDVVGGIKTVLSNHRGKEENLAESSQNASDNVETKDNVKRHLDICLSLNALYEAKNADYGDSFHKTFVENGITIAVGRMEDKLNRVKQLIKSEQKVKDESIMDTLLDLANYSIMTVLELEKK